MAYGNWDDVIKGYKNIYLHSRYEENAKAMLDLIPHLRKQFDGEDIIPGTSHGTLFLVKATKKTQIYIFYKGNNLYEIALYIPKQDEAVESVEVTFSDLITRLKEYIENTS
mgnify:CR=1 FL=1